MLKESRRRVVRNARLHCARRYGTDPFREFLGRSVTLEGDVRALGLLYKESLLSFMGTAQPSLNGAHLTLAFLSFFFSI